MRCRSGGARARVAAARCVLLPLLLTGAALLVAPAAGQEASQLLTDSPNCRLADASAAGVLPAGIPPNTDNDGAPAAAAGCSVVLPQLAPGETQLYTFEIAPKAEMSLLFVMRTRGGSALMDLFLPDAAGGAGDTSKAADMAATRTRTASSSGEAWLAVPADQIASRPGLYTLRLRGDGGAPTVEVAVVTPGPGTVLADKERDALAGLAKACCGEGSGKAPFCASIAPAAFAAKREWSSDLCHVPPNLCDTKGRLVSLSLRDAGLRCPTFPGQLAALGALQRLDLSGNDLAADVKAAAAVLAALPLRELYLSNAKLGGKLDCGLVKPKRRVIDLTSNAIGGGLLPCFLDSPVEELYLGRNELTGQLPGGDYARSVLSALSVGSHRRPKGGIGGPIPPGLLAMSTLLFLNLAGNDHTGKLPALPPNARLFNVSGNSLSGELPAFSDNLVSLDVTANGFSGPLPPLEALPQLQVLRGASNALTGPLPPLPPGLVALDLSNNALQGTLPPLPASLLSLDLGSNRGLEGDIGSLEVGSLRELRLGNNLFTGWVPTSATKSKTLHLLSLRVNKLFGPLPSDWDTPVLEVLLLSDNALEGTVPPSLARQPQLGTLRLEGNKLGGGLAPFADALPPASRLYHFDVSRNQLTGGLPKGLQQIGVFEPGEDFVMASPDGKVKLQRVFNVSENRLEGTWPDWLLSAVPQAMLACSCPVAVRLTGPDMRLACPRGITQISDFYWQTVSQSRYTCWNGRAEVPLTDYLSSPNNALSESDTSGPIFSDAAPWKPQPLSPGGSAGLAIGLLAAAALLGTLGYFVGYKRLWLERRAKQFERFEDGGGGGGGGQVVGGGGGNGLLSGGGVGPVNGSSSAGYSGSGANGFGGGGASNGGGNGYSSGGIDGGGKYAASPAVLQLSALPADNAPPQR